MKKHLTFCVALGLSVILWVSPILSLAAGSNSASLRSKGDLPGRKSNPAPKTEKRLLLNRAAKRAIQTPALIEGQSVTQLPDGKWLLVGGRERDVPAGTVAIKDIRAGVITSLSRGLQYARAWHSATLLPDGSVFIFGGIGRNGQIVDSAELYNPETQKIETIATPSLTPRAGHTATLLTDGSVLIVGGVTAKGLAVRKAELWNSRNRTATLLKSKLMLARQKQTAKLLADGNVQLAGGRNQEGESLESVEIYDAEHETFGEATTAAENESAPRLVASLPADGGMRVAVEGLIALRFSKPLRVETVSASTVALSSSQGEVSAKIVPAEGGMLAFVTPLMPLSPDTLYSLSLNGPTDHKNNALPPTTLSFRTCSTKDEDQKPQQVQPSGITKVDDDDWTPDARNLRGDWRSARPDSTARALPSLKAALGVTALSGQVLTLSGNPLANVTLQIEDQKVVTDQGGRFILSSIQSGVQHLTIIGETASRPGKTYGTFDVKVNVAAGQTTILPYTIWLPVLDRQHSVPLTIPTNREVSVTTPRIPDMEVRIPSNSVLRMPSGMHHMSPQIRRELGSVAITPIPIDRPPFPLPEGVTQGLLFTLQLHGARVEGLRGEKRHGLRIIFPNYANLPAGTRVDFWNYDSTGVGWEMYGHGTVTADGRQVMPDPGVELQSMYCLSFMTWLTAPPPTGPQPCNCSQGGDPVDLSTGLFVYKKTDLVLPDTIPLDLTRTYRQNDSGSHSFGIGTTLPYDMYIAGDSHSFGELILPDGGRVRYDYDSSRTDGAWGEHLATPSAFYKSKLFQRTTSVGWDIKLQDGTIYRFYVKSARFPYGSEARAVLEAIEDRYGNKLTITRDTSEGSDLRITKISTPNGRYVEFTYDAGGRIAQAQDNSGRVVSYTYDANGRLWKAMNVNGGVTEYTYDISHRMLTVKDPRGIIYLTNEYDQNGRVSKQTQADQSVYQFAYTLDTNGKVTQTDLTDPLGNIRRTIFNGNGYTLSETYAVGQTEQQSITFERQLGSNLILSITDTLGRRTAYNYDSAGNVTSVTRLSGTTNAVTSAMSYEPTYNQVATVTNPLNHTTSFAYDSSGNLLSVTDPLNHQNSFTYNAAGQMVSTTDALNHSAQVVYEEGDAVATTDALGRSLSKYLDSIGRATSITDPQGRTVSYEYDAMNRIKRATDPLQGVTAFDYDPNGNLNDVTDPRGGVTSYTYDNMDRVVARRDPLLHDESYEYDANGNLSQMTDRKGQVTTFGYDALNRLTLITYADSSTTSYTYDAVNRLTQVVDSLSGTITYGYDNLDRLTSETTSQGTISYSYDAAGRRATTTVTGQSAVSYSYDDANRLVGITQGTANVTIGYDAANRRTSLTLPNGIVTEYGYDNASQLTSIIYRRGATVLGDLVYEYDLNGKRTKVGGNYARNISPQPLTSATYNAANQQTSFNSQTLTYDLNGNLTNDGINSYTWDARNRLVSISGTGLSASFQYDAAGRRKSKTLNGVTTSYSYDGSNVVQEQSGGGASANILTGGLDEVFIRADSSGTWNLLRDGLGSSLALSDSTGALQTQYSYDAFGSSNSAGTASSNSAQYTGRENDATGLQFNRARYYSPSLQRFISEDPIGMAGGINLYAYVGNDPISFSDPFGHDKIDWSWWLLAHGAQVAAGFGDTISFGMTASIRSYTPGANAVSTTSGGYIIGVGGGIAWGMAFGGAVSARGAAAGGATVAAGNTATTTAPDFLGQANGPAIPIPEGAVGPTPVQNGNGFQYTGGSGGNGLSPNACNVRIMDPTLPKGPSPGYPNGYANYSNGAAPTPQSIDPYTGKTIGKSDPWWHIPLGR